MMIRLYSYLEDMMESRQLYEEPPFDHKLYLSDIMQLLQVRDSSILESAFEKALSVMRVSGVAADEHVRIIYSNSGHDVKKDISLSPLAAQLIVINSDCSNEFVARAQVYIMERI